ncbi:Hypothetical predicted protein [Pelobates cultripes]|uniref:Uncharacterized protein n=1 Tax=Pelobates cultripes TaxID=61616 RepID=A0AAD1R4E3_PELCU|nr:Hypothetical predicted protein [Pelobates cultripes]
MSSKDISQHQQDSKEATKKDMSNLLPLLTDMYGIKSHFLGSSSLQRLAEERVGQNLLKFQCNCILYLPRWVSQKRIDGIPAHNDQGTEEQPVAQNTMAVCWSRITVPRWIGNHVLTDPRG